MTITETELNAELEILDGLQSQLTKIDANLAALRSPSAQPVLSASDLLKNPDAAAIDSDAERGRLLAQRKRFEIALDEQAAKCRALKRKYSDAIAVRYRSEYAEQVRKAIFSLVSAAIEVQNIEKVEREVSTASGGRIGALGAVDFSTLGITPINRRLSTSICQAIDIGHLSLKDCQDIDTQIEAAGLAIGDRRNVFADWYKAKHTKAA